MFHCTRRPKLPTPLKNKYNPSPSVVIAIFELAHSDTWAEFSTLNIDLEFIYAVLSTDISIYISILIVVTQGRWAYKIRPSSLQARPAVLSGEAGTSKTP